MKLSEAIRLGEFAVAPTHMCYIELDHDKKPCGACAVGQAVLAAGYKPHVHALRDGGYLESPQEISKFMERTWPWVTQRGGARYGVNGVMHEISDLYEFNGWSMQRIAAYVATIEPQDAPTSIEQPISAEAMK